ncbi:hypothetical protein KAI92_02210 [Candidatus Parcubacteria bacterium]|nr:hypothetical protein [Candidatus Parcubacteria bacterium]
MKKLTVVFIVGFITLLFTSYAFAEENWVDQAIKNANSGNMEQAVLIVEKNKHKADFETAKKFSSNLQQLGLARIIWYDYIDNKYMDNKSLGYANRNCSSDDKAKAHFYIGSSIFIDSALNENLDLKSVMHHFTMAISLNNSYHEKSVSVLQYSISTILSSNEIFPVKSIANEIHSIKLMVEAVNAFGAHVNSANNYQKAMELVNLSSYLHDDDVFIKCLDIASLFTFTDKQRADIGNRYLQIARKTNDSAIYQKAENILGADVVSQTRYGASAKK